MSNFPQQSIKGYELQEIIGEGAFGAVYRAHQPVIDREVAVKVILPDYDIPRTWASSPNEYSIAVADREGNDILDGDNPAELIATLCTVLTSEGTTQVLLDLIRMDDHSGNAVVPTVLSGTVVIGPPGTPIEPPVDGACLP